MHILKSINYSLWKQINLPNKTVNRRLDINPTVSTIGHVTADISSYIKSPKKSII